MYSKSVTELNTAFESDEELDSTSNKATVKVEKLIYNRLKLIVKKKDTDIQTTLNKLVKHHVTKEELFQRYSPLLNIVTWEGSSMYIKDQRINNLVEVILKYKDEKGNNSETIVIYCLNCKSDYCVHTAFAAASDVIGELKLRKPTHK